MERKRFSATVRVSHEEHERTLFGRVCDAIGVSAAYVAHDIMPDIRAKLIDEGWFGRTPQSGKTKEHDTGAPWRTPGTIVIEGGIDRDPPAPPAPEIDIDR